mmetsp:Transcript_8422/g.12204  ORF Transcript_8422/g.12204 Transcript_8422/m.12204 type:complete len:202 (-) Transcript_8422:131-736(-)
MNEISQIEDNDLNVIDDDDDDDGSDWVDDGLQRIDVLMSKVKVKLDMQEMGSDDVEKSTVIDAPQVEQASYKFLLSYLQEDNPCIVTSLPQVLQDDKNVTHAVTRGISKMLSGKKHGDSSDSEETEEEEEEREQVENNDESDDESDDGNEIIDNADGNEIHVGNVVDAVEMVERLERQAETIARRRARRERTLRRRLWPRR